MTDGEIIAVVQAHKEGKEIQCLHKSKPGLGWFDCDPSWDFQIMEYRITPEPRKPREWYAEIPLNGDVGQIFTDSRQLTKGGELVKVREVIDDSKEIKYAFRKAVDCL